MIEIRYNIGREKIGEMTDISGSWQEFENLRQVLLKFLESDAENLSIDADKNISSEGWNYILKTIVVDKKGESVKVSVLENESLKIEGSKDNLEIFTSWLECNEENSSGYHSHYEYFEGNQYINAESIPLIIRVK